METSDSLKPVPEKENDIFYQKDMPVLGDAIEGYRIEELIHINSLLSFYRGKSETNPIEATIIVCRPETSASFRKSFELSRNLLARITIQTIPKILGAGVWGKDQPVMIRQYIPGKTLRNYLDIAESFPSYVCIAVAELVTEALAQISDAIEESRLAGFLHRCVWEIKPSDIVIDPSGKLFILSPCIDHSFDVRSYKTKTDINEQPPYSPMIDNSTIIYSLGKLIINMLYGISPIPDRKKTKDDVQKLTALAEQCGVETGNSPTGQFHSLFDFLDAIRELKSKTGIRISSMEIVESYFANK